MIEYLKYQSSLVLLSHLFKNLKKFYQIIYYLSSYQFNLKWDNFWDHHFKEIK